MLGNLIGTFIIILIGVTLAPVIADEVFIAKSDTADGTANAGNISGSSGTILGLVTLFFVLGVTSAAIGAAVMGLRQGGLM